jgi:hypothetical protein
VRSSRNSRVKHSFIQFYPDAWSAGTARMPRLVRSVYFEICLFNWDKVRAVPVPTQRLMLADLDNGAAIIDALVEEETLVRNDDGSVFSPRAMAEAEKSLAAWEAKSRGGRARNGKSDAANLQDSSNSDDKTVPQIEKEKEKERETEIDKEESPNGDSSATGAEVAVVTPDLSTVVDQWNDMARRCGLSQVAKMTDERKKRLKARIADHGLEAILAGILSIPQSPFLRGENDNGWKATFDWMLAPNYCVKLIEGGYHNRGRGGRSGWTQ